MQTVDYENCSCKGKLELSLFQTDDSLIGGMVVEIGDKRVDMSTATKIKKLKASLSLPL